MWHDLTHPLRGGMQVYPGDPEVHLEVCVAHRTHGYQVTAVGMGTHSGTHVDAPLHFVAGGKAVDAYPPERFLGQGFTVDVAGASPGEAIGLEAALPHRQAIERVPFVFFHSGWSRWFGAERYLRHPHLTAELAGWLVERGVRLVGVDWLNPDPTGGDAFPVHDVLLRSDVLIVENLTGLGRFAGRVGEFSLLPLKVQAGDGAPIRAIGRPA